jgi:tetratricopeptide (TPR) repeat protein
MVDGDRGQSRRSAISVDVNMSDVVVGRFLISARLKPVIGILILLFVVQQRAHAATPEQGTRQSDGERTENSTDHQFLSALRAYKAQQYAAAQKQLQTLVQTAPGSFEINELLGLVYVAQGEQAKANRFLAKAVRLNPHLTEARTALATNLLALHRMDEAEIQFKKAVELKPHDYDANHNLGEFYIQADKIAKAIPFLEHAQDANSAAYNNGYDLALAFDEAGQPDEARQQIQRLISLKDSAELHSLLGEVEEKSRNYLSSAAQYEQAARMEPSEQNILNWGAELLLHQTFAPAIEVFKAGTQRFPESARLHNGLGIAFYGAGQTDDAVRSFFRASDLTPSDPLPLTFLGKACDGASPSLADQIRSRLQNFLGRGAQSAELNYNLAMCWWKTNQTESKADRDGQVESLFKHAVTLDPNYADGYFQLGVLYAEERKYAEATEQYGLALKINPNAANTHYRLGQALARLGNDARAQEEFAVFEKLRQSESDATNKEQNQIQQFVYKIRKSDTN